MKYMAGMMITFFCLVMGLNAKTTPSDVYVEAHAIKNALGELSAKQGKTLLPVIDYDLAGAAPHHVYSLGAAINAKIEIYMSQNRIRGFKNKIYPAVKITPQQVLELMNVIKANLKRIEPSLRFSRQQVEGKKPADVMVELLYGNLWIDQLLGGKVAPVYPYHMTKFLEHELRRFAFHKNIRLQEMEPVVKVALKPFHVFNNVNIFYATMALYDTSLNGADNPLRPYDILSAEIPVQPVDVFTMSVFVLNYLYYLEMRAGLTPDSGFEPEFEQGIKPPQVYGRYLKLNYLLQQIVSRLEK